MRSIYLVAGAASILGLFAACGGDDKPPTLADGGGTANNGGKSSGTSGKKTAGGDGGDGGAGTAGTFMRGGTGGTQAQGNAGGEGGSGDITGPNDPLAPNIVITSPAAVDDPNGDGVLSGNTVNVTCEVTPSANAGGTAVNASTVKIAVLDGDGSVIVESTGTPTKNAYEYATALPLTAVPAGPVSSARTAGRSRP